MLAPVFAFFASFFWDEEASDEEASDEEVSNEGAGLLEVERGRLAASWSMGPLFVEMGGDVDEERGDVDEERGGFSDGKPL
jgi:hypothetical protein